MKIYAAPMEGITGYLWRNTHSKLFSGIDTYYTPFVVANQTLNFKTKEKKDVDPANNKEISVIPQIMANKANEFVWAAGYLKDLGYDTVNLNLGCPMATVVTKKKGSGFLAYPDELDAFFDAVFSDLPEGLAVSVKTRLGKDDCGDAVKLMEIYNKYPLSELIIHPRCQKDLYKGSPHMEVFSECMQVTSHKVCYNGNLFSFTDYHAFRENFPKIDAVMLGRGLISNPALAREFKGGEALTSKELLTYHDAIYRTYEADGLGAVTIMHRMKELWFYMGDLYGDEKLVHKLKKAKKSEDYLFLARKLIREEEITGSFHFS